MSAAQTTDFVGSLREAVAALPTDAAACSLPERLLAHAGLSGEPEKAAEYAAAFGAWAKQAVGQLDDTCCAALEATDFNDYYKLVMSRVQFVIARSLASAPHGGMEQRRGTEQDGAEQLFSPLCCFQTQLRRRPTFRPTVGGDELTLGVFDLAAAPDRDGSFADISDKFREALGAVGARCFSRVTLRRLIASAGNAEMEAALEPINEAWMQSLEGRSLFELLPEGEDFSLDKQRSGVVQLKLTFIDGLLSALAQGPWHLVTFVETPTLQLLASFMTSEICARAEGGWTRWAHEALLSFALVANQVAHSVLEPKRGGFSFFSGRRAPHPAFHLLQHLYLSHRWPRFTSSSLFAARVLGTLTSTPETLGNFKLVGTSAHEGPMAFQAMYQDSPLDAHLPVSSLLWTFFFWAITGNRTILPDAFGSATFRYMLEDLGFLEDVGAARQDSGSLARFASIFDKAPKMASEIEHYGEVADALTHGYVLFGAGGFLGERRLLCKSEFSIAGKITRVTMPPSVGSGGELRVGYAGKLGDFSESSGSWADYDAARDGKKARAKFITHADVDKEAFFAKLLSYAQAGDALHDRKLRGDVSDGASNRKAPAHLLSRRDAETLAAEMRRLCEAPCMAAGFAQYGARLCGYAERVEAAAALLPEQLPQPQQ